jgi:hypothetical protein
MKLFLKYSKKTLMVIGILLIALAVFLFIVGYFYGDKVKQVIVAEVSKRLNIEVTVKEIDFSLFKNFPEASVEFTTIQTNDRIHSSAGNLLQANKLSLLFDFFDILSGEYKIEKLVLENANLNLIVFDDSTNNFSIFQKSGESRKGVVEIDMQKVVLKDVNVSYLNRPSDQEYVFTINSGRMSGAFSSENYILAIDGKIGSKQIRSGQTIFLKDRELEAKLKIVVDQKQNIYKINEAKLTVAGITLNIAGFIQSAVDTKNLNLAIKSEKAGLPAFMGLIPEEYLQRLKDYSLDGDLIFDAKIVGEFSGNNLPSVRCNFTLDKGKLVIKESGLTLRNVSFKGDFDNGASRSQETYTFKLFGLKAGVNAGEIQGDLAIQNFERPLITASLSSSLNLEKIDEILKIESLKSITGRLDFDLKFSNSLKTFHKFTISDFISSKTSGSMKIIGVDLKLQDSPVNYNNLNGSFKFNNKDLLIENFSGNINESDFRMTGYFLNIMAYAFVPGEPVKIKADFSSSNLNMDDLLSIRKDKSGSTYRMKFSNSINFDLDLAIQRFAFGTFRGENISGKAIMKNNKLTIQDASLNSMEGRTLLNGFVDGNYHDKFWLSFKAELTDVNIQQLFFQCGEFGQQNITSNHLRGKMNATVYYKSFIDPELNIDPKSVYALGDLDISQGELIKYTPLYKLSKYIKKQELEHIKFSTLKNQIEIKDEVVYIPEMDIESSSLNLKIYGNHTFSNIIDYHVRVLLAELLSKKDRKKEEEIEGIFPEEDGLGQTTLFLRMTGNAEDPDISYDTKEVRKKISADMTREKKEIKDAFRREFGLKNDTVQPDREDAGNTQPDKGKDFKIDWDEAQQENMNGTQKPANPKNEPVKKTSKKEFIIEWDEEKDTLK